MRQQRKLNKLKMLELLYTAIINPTTVKNSKESKQIDNIWKLFKSSFVRPVTTRNSKQMKKSRRVRKLFENKLSIGKFWS